MSAARPTVRDDAGSGRGALVVSLDFELHWGIRSNEDGDGHYRDRLLGARDAVRKILELFVEHEVAATWAVVGLLLARSREEAASLSPRLRPAYPDRRADPFAVEVGDGESDDPSCFAPSLVDEIAATPRQEIATHTFSHYFCAQDGASPESFEADLRAAQAAAGARGVGPVRSLVFPRNQYSGEYLGVLRRCGVDVFRGLPPGRLWHRGHGPRETLRRAARLLDLYLPLGGPDTFQLSSIVREDGLADVRASRFLSPYRPALGALEPLRRRRIVSGLRQAARRRRLYHLWWHPHNFGRDLPRNLDMLGTILSEFSSLRRSHGMVSLTMAEAADLARADHTGGGGGAAHRESATARAARAPYGKGGR